MVIITGFVSEFGVDALAGYGLGSRLELMLVPIAFGIGAALTAAVGPILVQVSIIEPG